MAPLQSQATLQPTSAAADDYWYDQPWWPDRFAKASRLLAHLHRYELALRKHWWIPVLALSVSLGPVSYFTFTAPPSYQSVGKMWMSGKLNLKDGQLYSEELSSFMGTQVELLRSQTIQERALAKLQKTQPQGPLASASTNPGPAQSFQLNVKDYPKTAIIELRAIGSESQSTRRFLDAVMEEYQLFRKEVRAQSSDTTLASISEQVGQLEQELKRQQERLHSFLVSNNLVLLQEQGSSAGAFVGKLNKQLASLQIEYQFLQLVTPDQLTQAANRQNNPILEDTPLSEQPAPELLMSLLGPQADFFKATQQIQLLQARRDELSRFLRPTHPKIIRLDEQIAEQERAVEVYRRQSLSQMENRRQALQLQIQGLEASAKEWEAKALETSKKMAEYERIRQDVQRTQSLYDRLLGVIQSVDVNRTLDQESVRVMEKASLARPVRNIIKPLAIGLVAGLVIGFGALYIMGLFDDRFTSIFELRNQLPEVVVGQVPEVPTKKSHDALELVRADDDRHVFAESFRNLRSSLLFMFTSQKRPKTILITSSLPEEGKSTMAANLAATLALAGSRILLVDADLRRTGLHKMFSLPIDPGLANIMSQEVNYTKAVAPTSITNLFLLPAGTPDGNPGELFLAPSTDVFLANVYPQYDYIIFDSAPILATDDTTSLAPKLDGVLFVVRGGFTPARLAREALGLLRQRHVNLLGLIFNRAIPTRSDYYYYYRYNDYYYYKRPSKEGEKSRRHRSERSTTPEPRTPAEPQPK
jgi:capsular exopolysaccharide synthesis family protein